MKKIKFSLKPDKNKKFKTEMFNDGLIVRETNISGEKLKSYMEDKLKDRIDFVRLATKLFRARGITIEL